MLSQNLTRWNPFLLALGALVVVAIGLCLLHVISYRILKNRIISQRRWELNVCCGKTDGGGVNADIAKHADLPNLTIVDVYHLPFGDKQFDTLLCSHTVEHVEDPERFLKEMERVSRDVTLVIPPLWDLSAVVNIFEHRWIFLSFRKVHRALPRYIPLPLASAVQDRLGQRVHA